MEKRCVWMGKIWMLDLGLWRHKSHQYLCLKHLRSICTKSATNVYTSNKGHGTPSLPPSQLHPHKPFRQEHDEKSRFLFWWNLGTPGLCCIFLARWFNGRLFCVFVFVLFCFSHKSLLKNPQPFHFRYPMGNRSRFQNDSWTKRLIALVNHSLEKKKKLLQIFHSLPCLYKSHTCVRVCVCVCRAGVYRASPIPGNRICKTC